MRAQKYTNWAAPICRLFSLPHLSKLVLSVCVCVCLTVIRSVKSVFLQLADINYILHQQCQTLYLSLTAQEKEIYVCHIN